MPDGVMVDRALTDALASATTLAQQRAAWAAFRARAFPTPAPPAPPASVQPTPTNTGPTGTLTPYTGPLNITTPGVVIRNADMVVPDGAVFSVDADNVTIRNSRIRYAGTSTSTAGRFTYGTWQQPRHGLKLDHVELDGNHRSEYGLRAYGDFTLTASKLHGASHVIDAFGDPATGQPTMVAGCCIYDSDDKPYATDGSQYQGHSAAVYFSGCNSPVTIQGNTIVTPYQFPTGHVVNATAAIAIYPTEGTIKAGGSYVVDGNWISGGGYILTARSDGQTGTIPLLRFTNNTLTGQWGGPGVSNYGLYNVLDNVPVQRVFTGNRYGTDVANAAALPTP